MHSGYQSKKLINIDEIHMPLSIKNTKSTALKKAYPKIKSNITCYKCGGKDHTLNVCTTRNNDKLKCLRCKPIHKAAIQTSSGMEYQGYDGYNDDPRDTFFFEPDGFVHVTYQRDLLHNFSSDNSGMISGLDPDNMLEILGTGTLHFLFPDGTLVTFGDVKYIPSCGRNLISFSRAVFNGAIWNIRHDFVYDNYSDLPIAVRTAPYHGLRYEFSLPCLPSISSNSGFALNTTPNLYARFGCPSRDIVNDLAKKFPSYSETIKFQLEEYIRSLKQTSTTSRSSVTAPLELVHSSVCGPFPEPGIGNNLYFVIFVDEYTHMKRAFCIKDTSEVFECTRSYFIEAEEFFHNRGGYKPVAFRTDDNYEYLSFELQGFLKTRGIAHQCIAPYSSYPNAVSKRAIRTITEKSRIMMSDASTPLSFWSEAVTCSNYITNRLPSNAIKMQYPYKRWYKKMPNLDNLRPFGCKASALIPTLRGSSMLSTHSIRGIMVGYGIGSNAYRIFDIDTGKIAICENVKFDEFSFPFRTMTEIPPHIRFSGSQSKYDAVFEAGLPNDNKATSELAFLFSCCSI